MSLRARGVIVGCSGFVAGAAVARIFPWSTLPKAVLVGIVAALVSTVALVLVRPRTPSNRAR